MKNNTRWTVLFASMAILLCAGSLYSYSVFAKPLSVSKGWSMPDVMLAFTINAAIAPIPTILGGFIRLYTKSGAWKNSSPGFQFLYTKRQIPNIIKV